MYTGQMCTSNLYDLENCNQPTPIRVMEEVHDFLPQAIQTTWYFNTLLRSFYTTATYIKAGFETLNSKNTYDSCQTSEYLITPPQPQQILRTEDAPDQLIVKKGDCSTTNYEIIQNQEFESNLNQLLATKKDKFVSPGTKKTRKSIVIL
jgi:hypothetical protein